MPASERAAETWRDAQLAAALFAVDPLGLGGIVLRSGAGPLRDRWLEDLRSLLSDDASIRRVPANVADDRLLGGLDLAATLKAGCPVAEQGLLSALDGGFALLAMAERLPSGTAAHIAAALDTGETIGEREGLKLRSPSRFGVIAFDEGIEEDECPPTALIDRLAFLVSFEGVGLRAASPLPFTQREVAAARKLLPRVSANDAVLEALCAAAQALAVPSLRAPLLALRAARAMAALQGRTDVNEEDAKFAARLVIAPRARAIPESERRAESEPPPDEQPQLSQEDQSQSAEMQEKPLEDMVLEAAEAAVPPGLLALLQAGVTPSRRATAGRSGSLRMAQRRGRPAGVRPGVLRSGSRLNLIATLRSAAPWQPLRRQQAKLRGNETKRVLIEKDDFRITRFKQHSETVTIFVVDASGSAALHRLAEAKGAVEMLLADCYVRRDQVALLSFRDRGAELLLPPTRSLLRAKRCLAQLPGGGGTPLAAGLESALALADTVRRKGQSPSIVLLSDGRANVARDGAPGREKAAEDAVSAARALCAADLPCIVIDTAPRPGAAARRVAEEMHARYLPLPHADAGAISQVVRSAA